MEKKELSLSKEKLKFLTSLQEKKYRAIHGLFPVEGILPAEELLQSEFKLKEFYYIPWLKNRPGFDELLEKVKQRGVEAIEVDGQTLKKLSSEQAPQGVLAIAEKRDFSENQLQGNLLLCHQIQDPGNLGTLFRIAHWFGLGGIILTSGSVEAWNPKVVRSSMGSFFHIPWILIDSASEIPQAFGEHQLLLSSPHAGRSVSDFPLKKPFILALGNESRGLAEDFFSEAERITLPRLGGAESLNVAAAAAAILARLLL
ncbi:MAG TPA: RNA methyltransferase [Candidatus Marinimicrobia bacterium]|nr:RNA methyltransferase [Candidatus Neomarinimicrobiota bacterium]